jgi:hypothetical protein
VLSHAVADLLAVEVCGTSSDAFRAALLEVRRVWAAGLETFPKSVSGTPDKSLRDNTLATPPAVSTPKLFDAILDAAEHYGKQMSTYEQVGTRTEQDYLNIAHDALGAAIAAYAAAVAAEALRGATETGE